jgi:hypothetical protein
MDSDYHLRISRGVPQGSPLSCSLFLFAIEPLLLSLVQNFPGIVLEAYADDIAIISKKDSLLPKIQCHIEHKGALIGLKVNVKKSCLLPLVECQDLPLTQRWNSPIVNEFKYLGITLSKEISEKTVYSPTIAKFRQHLETAKDFGGPLIWHIMYHKIFAISLFSHLLQFVLPSTALCNQIDSLTHGYLDPMKTMSKEVLFALPGTYLPPPFPLTLAEYACLFPNECIIEGCWQELKTYNQDIAHSQLRAKIESVAPLNNARALNLYALSGLKGSAITTTLLLNMDAVPYYKRLKHIDPHIKDVCPLCKTGSFDPQHLFQCPELYTIKNIAEGNVPFVDALESLEHCQFHLSEPCPNIGSLAAIIHTIWVWARTQLYLKIKINYSAVANIFQKSSESIKKANLNLQNLKKGLRIEDELHHVLQDLIPDNELRKIEPPLDNSNHQGEKKKEEVQIFKSHRKYRLYINSSKKYERVHKPSQDSDKSPPEKAMPRPNPGSNPNPNPNPNPKPPPPQAHTQGS